MLCPQWRASEVTWFSQLPFQCPHHYPMTGMIWDGGHWLVFLPRSSTSEVRGLLGTGLHSRRWAVGEWAKLHLYLQPLPITRITAWALPPVRSAVALDSHRSANPTVNCACEGSRVRAPYENLMPGDLRWSWGADASAGERLQIQIIISREVWLHGDHNKWIACRRVSKPYQWVASGNKLRAPTNSALWWVV